MRKPSWLPSWPGGWPAPDWTFLWRSRRFPEDLLGLDNVVLLPHLGSGTHETRADNGRTDPRQPAFLRHHRLGPDGGAGMSVAVGYVASQEGRAALMFLGSTAQRVILEAGCPVTAVKADVGPR